MYSGYIVVHNLFPDNLFCTFDLRVADTTINKNVTL